MITWRRITCSVCGRWLTSRSPDDHEPTCPLGRPLADFKAEWARAMMIADYCTESERRVREFFAERED